MLPFHLWSFRTLISGNRQSQLAVAATPLNSSTHKFETSITKYFVLTTKYVTNQLLT